MNYRCRACQHEEARGCLPTATCGLYALVLLALSVGCIAGFALILRSLIDVPPAKTEPVSTPWWVGVFAVVVGLVLVVVGMVVINFMLELAEWLVYSRRRCPMCGARRWSRGFSKGFGL